MKKQLAIIIEDEARARELLQAMVREYLPELEIVAVCSDLSNGVKAIRKLRPDLVFLDIEMPGHSGLELLDFFSEDEVDFGIIFTTAYNQYAIRAFRLSAVDYLLKPIEADELVRAYEQFQKYRSRNIPTYFHLGEQLKSNSLGKIAVPTGSAIQFIDFDEIHYLKAYSSYTEIVFTSAARLVVSRTLKNFEEILNDEPTFFRCHKSYLVNTRYVTGYTKSDGGHLSLTNDVTVPISPERSNELMKRIPMIRR